MRQRVVGKRIVFVDCKRLFGETADYDCIAVNQAITGDVGNDEFVERQDRAAAEVDFKLRGFAVANAIPLAVSETLSPIVILP